LKKPKPTTFFNLPHPKRNNLLTKRVEVKKERLTKAAKITVDEECDDVILKTEIITETPDQFPTPTDNLQVPICISDDEKEDDPLPETPKRDLLSL